MQRERAVLDSVKADLERLLNARRPPWPLPECLDQVDRALAGSGLPDLGSIELSQSRGIKALAEKIKGSIEAGEPRLRDVKVTAAAVRRAGSDGGGGSSSSEAARLYDGTLHITIRASVSIGDEERRVRYGSSLNEATVRLKVHQERA